MGKRGEIGVGKRGVESRGRGETAGGEMAGALRRGAESQSRREWEEERVILPQPPGPSIPILLTPAHPF